MSWRPLLAALVLVPLASGCLDDGLPDLQTGPVLLRIDELGDVTRDDDCPIDDVASLLGETCELVDTAAVRSALDGSLVARTTPGASGSPQLTCELTGTDGQLAIEVTEAPSDIAQYATSFARRPRDAGVDESTEFRGGRFHRVCTSGDVATQRCGVAWVDPVILVAVSVTGADASDLDVRAVEERFAYVLPLVVDRLTDG